MKSMILAIRLKYFYLTYKGIKTLEIRKTVPKDFVGVVYEYVSKTNFEKELQEIPENEREFFKQFKGKVGLKFTLRKVEHYRCMVHIAPKLVKVILKTTHLYSEQEKELLNNILENSCLSKEELAKYLEKETTAFSGFYAYHIEDLVIFDKPKELSEFKHYQDERIKVMGNPYPMSFFGSVAHHYEKKSVLKPLTTAPQNFMYIESEE